jgi:hypothetical protein
VGEDEEASEGTEEGDCGGIREEGTAEGNSGGLMA